MQTEIVLLTTRSKNISLSQSLRDIIPLYNIFNELLNMNFTKGNNKIIKTYSTFYEDNRGVLELVREPKYRPQTKYITLKYYYFRWTITKKIIIVNAINTKDK